MKIIETNIMRGPNYWSDTENKLIVLKVNIAKVPEEPSAQVVQQQLQELFATLHTVDRQQHDFSWLAQEMSPEELIAQLALQLQVLSGAPLTFAETRPNRAPGVYHVLFSYEHEKAGIYAGKAAVRILEALSHGLSYSLEADLQDLRDIKSRHTYGPSTGALVEEAERRNIPYVRLDEDSLIAMGYGDQQQRIRATIADPTSGIGIDLAGDKNETKRILWRAHVPVPQGVLIYAESELETAVDKVGYPLVIKPLDGNHGNGITTRVSSLEEAQNAFKLAKEFSNGIIVETFISGADYRFLVINYQLVAAAKRTPAHVTGDGKSTIRELVGLVNEDPDRGDHHENIMTKIEIDELTFNLLEKQGLTPESVLQEGKTMYLKGSANISSGGTATDVTMQVHPTTKFVVERAARLLRLDICGIDLVATSIDEPLTIKTGAIVEINAAPGLRMHLSPSQGAERNVAAPILDMLFPENKTGRIPIIAITGTNGKTTTTRLLAHLAKEAGYKVGYTTSEGIYIQGHLILEGDCTGPASAQTVLLDPTINFAVLESARGGIIRAGLGFDRCDISIVTNVTDDHLGLKDIHTIEGLARVKATVAKSTAPTGYAILNADDDLVYAMREGLKCHVCLFSTAAYNPRIEAHCANEGTAVVLENDQVTIRRGRQKISVADIRWVPLSMKGKSSPMIKNILPAALAAYLQGFDLADIRNALNSFIPSAAQTPGRMNLFDFKNRQLLIDYAHNPDGFRELKKYTDGIEAPVKIGILSGTGDRRDEDLITIGQIAAQMFDEIIIKHDEDMRDRTAEQITGLLLQGILAEKQMPVQVISNEHEAIDHALKHAPENAFITVCADKVLKTISYVEQAQKAWEVN
jgi:cyanophycin synthetase